MVTLVNIEFLVSGLRIDPSKFPPKPQPVAPSPIAAEARQGTVIEATARRVEPKP